MKKWMKTGILGICLAAVIGAGLIAYNKFFPENTLAYLTDKTGATNTLTVGNVTAEIIETFNPVTLQTGTNSYTKKVQVQNSGKDPAYARVWLEFSDCDVEGISKISTNGGSNWYTLSQLKAGTGLSNGWVYQSTGTLAGYFYYPSPVAPGGKTPALITNVKTEFIDKTADTNQTINKTKRDYDVLVYAETVQQAKLFPGTVDKTHNGLNTSYVTAWTEFLNKKNN